MQIKLRTLPFLFVKTISPVKDWSSLRFPLNHHQKSIKTKLNLYSTCCTMRNTLKLWLLAKCFSIHYHITIPIDDSMLDRKPCRLKDEIACQRTKAITTNLSPIEPLLDSDRQWVWSGQNNVNIQFLIQFPDFWFPYSKEIWLIFIVYNFKSTFAHFLTTVQPTVSHSLHFLSKSRVVETGFDNMLVPPFGSKVGW